MNKPIVLCDIDDVIFPLMASVLPLYNNAYNDNLMMDDITGYDIHEFIKNECVDFWGEFVTEDLLLNAKPIDGCVDVLSQLAEEVKFYFATAAHSYTIGHRNIWLQQHFGFYSEPMLIRIQHKQLLHGDLLIDDYYNNIAHGHYKGLIFSRPWNKQIVKRGLRRIDQWDQNSLYIIKSMLGI